MFLLFNGPLRVEQVLHVNGQGRLPIKLAPSPDPASKVGVQPPGRAVAPTAGRAPPRWSPAPGCCRRRLRTRSCWAVAGRAFPAGRNRVRAEHPDFGTGRERGDLSRFRSDRGREYDEFAERCSASWKRSAGRTRPGSTPSPKWRRASRTWRNSPAGWRRSRA